MQYIVTNRWTGAALFTAEIECAESASIRVKLGLAARWAWKTKTSLRGAYLRGADLQGAYLRGETEDEKKANAVESLVARASRSDGYEFFAFRLQIGGVKIIAGCRYFSVAEFRAHVKRSYPKTDKA